MSDSFEDALREALEKIPPADLVGRDGITKETVLMMNAMAGKTVEVTDQKLRADDDGAVGIQRTTGTATMSPLTISIAEAERLGLTPEEIPHVNGT